ncbi:MAG: D-aminoacylase [Anaerolineaceae bacterium]|nr:D-aminoacylase [Anaerolineaceae bacterium]
MFDILIKNGTIIDGTQAPRYRGDVGLVGDRITAVGDLGEAAARQTIDAHGKIVAPGFVDVHTHSDAWLLKTPHFLSKTTQGFTTEVLMADGISYAPVNRHTVNEWLYYLRALNGLRHEEYQGWESLAEFMDLHDRRVAQNVITHIPYANLRSMACGFGKATPDDFQMNLIRAEVEKGMAEGAVGLSTGLDYIAQCFASTAELVEACAPLAARQGLYVTHVRYKKGVLAGVQEAVAIGRRAGVPVHISHLKGSTPAEAEALLAYIDTVATQEVDFSFDVYPYLPSSTMLNYLLPYEVWEDGPLAVLSKLHLPHIRARFNQSLSQMDLNTVHIAWVPGKENSQHQGKPLARYVAELGKSPADALCDLLIEENLAVLLVFNRGDDDLVRPFLTHPCYMMGSDGIYHEDGLIHPRHYGSAARLLGPCVRDKHWFSLEAAVYKLSHHPAQRFGLTNRGQVRAGCFADLVVFDAATVADRATFADPHQYSVGIEHVLVNGVPIIADGQPIENLAQPLPGRALRFKG